MPDPLAPPATARLLFDFRLPGFAPWAPVDDRVMGGRSRSSLVPSGAGSALFSGAVVLEGGGFASVRSAPAALSSPGALDLLLCARGDGRRYKLSLRCDDAFDGPVWQAPFAPPVAAFGLVRLPFASFVPTFRGRPLGPAGGLDPALLVTCGLVVADGRGGPFRLELAWIAA